MPNAGKPCPACKNVQAIAGPVCRKCLSVSLGFSKEEIRTLILHPESPDAQELREHVDWWIDNCPINQHDRPIV